MRLKRWDKITFYLASGATIKVKARGFSATFQQGVCLGYKAEKMRGAVPININVDHIVAITQK